MIFVNETERTAAVNRLILDLTGMSRLDPTDPATERRYTGLDWPQDPLTLTMIGVARMQDIHNCVRDVIERGITGDLMECGVWRGGAAILMRRLLGVYGDTERKVWVADSFQGIPPDASRNVLIDKGVDFAPADYIAVSLDQVQTNFENYGALDDQVKFLPGWFKDTLPDSPVQQIAVLRLDGDMYESTMDCLNALYDRIAPGGWLIVDDYALPTCRRAVDEFRALRGIRAPIEQTDWTGVRWQVPVGKPTTTVPVFSILHAVAWLPFRWLKAWKTWSEQAHNHGQVEYIIACHERDFQQISMEVAQAKKEFPWGLPVRLVVNNGRYNCVDNWNAAAAASTGEWLVLASDNLYAPKNWDVALLTEAGSLLNPLTVPAVLHIDTGSPRDGELMSHAVMSRALYERWGYFYHPDYESMYADDDLTEHAVMLGVIRNARAVRFNHETPHFNRENEQDAVFRQQNRAEAYELGRVVLARRREERFGEPEGTATPMPTAASALADFMASRKTIAICTPGQQFSGVWMANWTQFYTQMLLRHNVQNYFGYSSNVYATRGDMTDAVLGANPKPDYVLWLDDDNILSYHAFQMLLEDLETHPEYDGIAGWCWIQPDGYYIPSRSSVGWMDNQYRTGHFTEAELNASPTDLVEIGWTGFPVFLMRREALESAGSNPFAPVFHANFNHGMSGEDVAFCIHARERGRCRFAVDRRVKIPHLKLRSAEPSDLQAVAITPRKNEFEDANQEAVAVA